MNRPEFSGGFGERLDHCVPFEGIVLADTFQMTEDGDTLDDLIFPQENERASNQLATDIRVIVGNPPCRVDNITDWAFADYRTSYG